MRVPSASPLAITSILVASTLQGLISRAMVRDWFANAFQRHSLPASSPAPLPSTNDSAGQNTGLLNSCLPAGPEPQSPEWKRPRQCACAGLAYPASTMTARTIIAPEPARCFSHTAGKSRRLHPVRHTVPVDPPRKLSSVLVFITCTGDLNVVPERANVSVHERALFRRLLSHRGARSNALPLLRLSLSQSVSAAGKGHLTTLQNHY